MEKVTSLTLNITHDETGQFKDFTWACDDPEATVKDLSEGTLAFLLECYSKLIPTEHIHDFCQKLAETFEAALYVAAMEQEAEDDNE